MPLQILFWVLMLLWLVLGWGRRGEPFANWGPGWLLEFVLFFVVGWKVFGPAVT